jgi:hypothetical protein
LPQHERTHKGRPVLCASALNYAELAKLFLHPRRGVSRSLPLWGAATAPGVRTQNFEIQNKKPTAPKTPQIFLWTDLWGVRSLSIGETASRCLA